MSINVEIALVLGLFIIGAVVLAIDNMVDAIVQTPHPLAAQAKTISRQCPTCSLGAEEKAVAITQISQ